MPTSDHTGSQPPTRRAARERSIAAESVATAPARRRPRVWPWLVGILSAVVIGAGAATTAFASEAIAVRDELTQARDSLLVLPDLIAAGDLEQVSTVATQVTQVTDEVAARVDGPLWELASRVPAVGQNVAAVQGAARATNRLVSDALPVGISILDSLDPAKLAVEGGGINLEPLRGLQASIADLRTALAGAAEELQGIDRGSLIGAVAEPLAQLDQITVTATPALETIEKNLPTILAMAGGDGPRNYLLVFQNIAESRATGGNPAAALVLTVDGGRFELADQASSADFGGRSTSVDLAPEAESLYEVDTTRVLQNYNRTPDFPTTARLFESLWQNAAGVQIDGVISLDPVALAHMLEVTGPVDLGDGLQITSENAVQLLLSDAYRWYPNGLDSDIFFAGVTAKVFDAISAGGWDPLAMAKQFERSMAEQRLYMWMLRPEEQALAVETGTDGALAADNAAETQVGIYLNDSSYSKLEYYLSTSVAVTCDATQRTITTTVSMTNSIPNGDFTSYVLGARNGRVGLPRTTMLLDTLYFAPPGGQIVAASPERGDIRAWDRFGMEQGREGRTQTIAVPLGETRTASYTSTLPAEGLGPLTVRYTPTVTDTPVTIDATCEALFPAAPTAAAGLLP